MECTLIGIAILDFVSKSNGGNVKGHNLFVTYADPRVIGLKCEKFFVGENVALPNLKPNDSIVLAFNRYGKVAGVTISK